MLTFLGADVLLLEAPRSEEEMQRFCDEVPDKRMANMLEEDITPLLPTERSVATGLSLAAYPLTLLSTAAFAMRKVLMDLQAGRCQIFRHSFATHLLERGQHIQTI